jgi:hypothetical protein
MKTKSYYSDPKWNNSFVGRFLWIYKGRGILELAENLLTFSDKSVKMEFNKEQIIEIDLGRYHRTAKPLILNFIDIKYKDDGPEEKRIFFTPTLPNRNPWLTTVWTTNKNVKKCLEEINEWKKT